MPDGSALPEEDVTRYNTVIDNFGGGRLIPSNRDWQEHFESNHWIRHYMRLPALSAAVAPTLHDLSLGDHIAAVYGSRTAFARARKQLASDLPYLGRREPRSLFNRLRWSTRSARGNRQYYDRI